MRRRHKIARLGFASGGSIALRFRVAIASTIPTRAAWMIDTESCGVPRMFPKLTGPTPRLLIRKLLVTAGVVKSKPITASSAR